MLYPIVLYGYIVRVVRPARARLRSRPTAEIRTEFRFRNLVALARKRAVPGGGRAVLVSRYLHITDNSQTAEKSEIPPHPGLTKPQTKLVTLFTPWALCRWMPDARCSKCVE